MTFSEFGTFKLETRNYGTLKRAHAAIAAVAQKCDSLRDIKTFIHAQDVTNSAGFVDMRFFPVLLPQNSNEVQMCICTAREHGFLIYKA